MNQQRAAAKQLTTADKYRCRQMNISQEDLGYGLKRGGVFSHG